MHLIWLGAVLPWMLFVVWSFPQSRRLEVWAYSFLGTLAVTVAWVVIGSFFMGSKTGGLTTRSMFFALITAIDLPIIAVMVGSAINWIFVRQVGETPLPNRNATSTGLEHMTIVPTEAQG